MPQNYDGVTTSQLLEALIRAATSGNTSRTEKLRGVLNERFAELEGEKGEVSPGYSLFPRAYALLCSLAGITVDSAAVESDWKDQSKVWHAYETALMAHPEKEALLLKLLELLQTNPIGH